jgi:hypothetical protein
MAHEIAPEKDVPLAADFEAAGIGAKQKGDEFFLCQLPWKAGIVIADALRNYFDVEAPMRCFVCDQSRNTKIDMAIEDLADQIHKLSYVMLGIESLFEETDFKIPTNAEAQEERIKMDLRARKMPRRWMRQPIPISDELRLIVKEWTKPADDESDGNDRSTG